MQVPLLCCKTGGKKIKLEECGGGSLVGRDGEVREEDMKR